MESLYHMSQCRVGRALHCDIVTPRQGDPVDLMSALTLDPVDLMSQIEE